MKLMIISCSQKAYNLSKELKQKLENEFDYEVISVVKCKELKQESIPESIPEFVGKWFYQIDAILFLCATGIAVRSIAPCIQHKSKDPAVVVMDEKGKYCISLLSGHMGGANRLAQIIAGEIGAVPVITTATDIEDKFSVDAFAKENNLAIENWKLAKDVSTAFLQEWPVGYISPMGNGNLYPKDMNGESIFELIEKKLLKVADGSIITEAEMEYNVSIDYERKQYHEKKCLCLIPKVLILGIGCKKHTPLEKIEYAVRQCFLENHLYESAICKVASIDLKKEEAALKQFSAERKLPFVVFSSEELMAIEGSFTASPFVKRVTGVDNVCERSAIATCEDTGGMLLVEKSSYDGVTIAVALKYENGEEQL